VPSLRLSLLTLYCASLLGCAAAATPESATATGGTTGWQLQVSVDGGFAGIAQRFSTSADSSTLLATDARRGRDTPVPLSAAERQELQRLVMERIGQPDVEQRSPSCRDCFNFELTLTPAGGGKTRQARYDSGSLDASPDARLIGRVIEMGRAGMAR
jgi:hypothetical protein